MTLSILRRVEAGPRHSLASRGFRGAARAAALELVSRGLLRLLPARGKFPRRFAVTSSGSHVLGSFDSCADIDAEVWVLRRQVA